MPNSPYVGLWARLYGFHPNKLAQLVTERRAVRGPLMRSTLQLATSRDYLTLRPLVQPVLERGLYTGSPFDQNLPGVDIEVLMAAEHCWKNGRACAPSSARCSASGGPLRRGVPCLNP